MVCLDAFQSKQTHLGLLHFSWLPNSPMFLRNEERDGKSLSTELSLLPPLCMQKNNSIVLVTGLFFLWLIVFVIKIPGAMQNLGCTSWNDEYMCIIFQVQIMALTEMQLPLSRSIS